MYKVKIKVSVVPATRKLKEGESASRPQTEEERAKWLKRLSRSKYVFHLGKRG